MVPYSLVLVTKGRCCSSADHLRVSASQARFLHQFYHHSSPFLLSVAAAWVSTRHLLCTCNSCQLKIPIRYFLRSFSVYWISLTGSCYYLQGWPGPNQAFADRSSCRSLSYSHCSLSRCSLCAWSLATASSLAKIVSLFKSLVREVPLWQLNCSLLR